MPTWLTSYAGFCSDHRLSFRECPALDVYGEESYHDRGTSGAILNVDDDHGGLDSDT